MENIRTEKIIRLIMCWSRLLTNIRISAWPGGFLRDQMMNDSQIFSGKTRFDLLNLTICHISVIAFPYKQKFNGTFSDQSDTIQTLYRMVTFIKKIFFFTSYLLVIYFFRDHGNSSNNSGSAIFLCDLF